MHRPVLSPLGIFARPVERIDDPAPAVRQPFSVVRTLLREHRIAGPPLRQAGQDESVGDLIRDMAKRRARKARSVALFQQQPSRFLRQMGRQILVGHRNFPFLRI